MRAHLADTGSSQESVDDCGLSSAAPKSDEFGNDGPSRGRPDAQAPLRCWMDSRARDGLNIRPPYGRLQQQIRQRRRS